MDIGQTFFTTRTQTLHCPYEEMSTERVYFEIKEFNCTSVCITGGEPLVQREELIELLKLLRQFNYWVQICTNGTIWDEEVFELCDFVSMDMKAPSSGMKSDLENARKLSHFYSNPWGFWRGIRNARFEIKVVVGDIVDLLFALGSVRPRFEGMLILQPVGGVKMQDLVKEILTHNIPNIKILPQLHKLIWGLERRR
jgi:7-carboxy-7-deazaguanine synthase